jgi:hypothetical protein
MDFSKAQETSVVIKRLFANNYNLVFARMPDVEVQVELLEVNKWPGFRMKPWDETYVLILNPSYDEKIVMREIIAMLEKHGLTIQKKYW